MNSFSLEMQECNIRAWNTINSKWPKSMSAKRNWRCRPRAHNAPSILPPFPPHRSAISFAFMSYWRNARRRAAPTVRDEPKWCNLLRIFKAFGCANSYYKIVLYTYAYISLHVDKYVHIFPHSFVAFVLQPNHMLHPS